MLKYSLFAAALLTIGLAASAAQAVEGCFYSGYSQVPWGNGNYGGSNFGQEYQPYFSLHPPVYYSGIEPRTMGQSPYPYLPPVAPISGQYAPAGYYPTQPMMAAPPAQPAPVRPLMIHNPYVTEAVTPPAPTPAKP